LAFPSMADVVPRMSAEAQHVLKREADRERMAETRAQNQAGAARVEKGRRAGRAMTRAGKLDDRAATYKELEAGRWARTHRSAMDSHWKLCTGDDSDDD